MSQRLFTGDERACRRDEFGCGSTACNWRRGLGVATWRAVVAFASIGRVRMTVLIVDDHADFRESARALLEAEGFDVVGEAADGSEAIAEVERLRPDVVLLDIQLPDQDGFTVA